MVGARTSGKPTPLGYSSPRNAPVDEEEAEGNAFIVSTKSSVSRHVSGAPIPGRDHFRVFLMQSTALYLLIFFLHFFRSFPSFDSIAWTKKRYCDVGSVDIPLQLETKLITREK